MANTAGNSYSVIISPPDTGSQWFPVQFYVDGIAATASWILIEYYSGAFPVSVNLSIDIAAPVVPEGPLTVEPGSCPQRQTGAGVIPTLPAIASGFVTIDDEFATDGTQVVALMNHPTLGKCWTDAVQTTNGAYATLLISPPSSGSGWFPIAFYVGGQLAQGTRAITASDFSAGAMFSVNLSR